MYLPYGYSEEEKYNVFYLSHGGWSNETTLMGTDTDPHPLKYVMDHAIEDGKIQPLIIVLPTYNNTSEEDSGDYSLAIELTDRFHNELVNDLIPAVEGNTVHMRKIRLRRDSPHPEITGDSADFPWDQ